MNSPDTPEKPTAAQRLDQEIREIEIAVHSAEPSRNGDALARLVKLINSISGRSTSNDADYIRLLVQHPHLMRLFATRIAAALCDVLLNPRVNLNSHVQLQLMAARVDINDLFRVSGFGSTLHARNILIDREQKKTADGSGGMSGTGNIYRSILLSTLDDIYPEQLKYLISVAGGDEGVMILSLLDERAVFSVRGEEYRSILLQEKRAFASLPLEIEISLLVSHVWMFCSYATSPAKHEIKIYLNDWFKRLLGKHKIKFSKLHAPKSMAKKKTMVIAAEAFKTGHAMYRWYAPIIRELKTHYRLVLVARQVDVNDEAIALFDQYIEVKSEIIGLQDVLNSCRPDVVLYPSLGMRAWSIALSNIRWAPLQLMMPGHPATSHVETIDAVVTTKDVIALPSRFTENVLALDSSGGNNIDANTSRIPKRPGGIRLQNVIRIAVPCVSMKINSAFMSMVQEAQKSCSKSIQFTFFPNELGVPLGAITSRINEWLPSARVAPRMGYDNYLEVLANHDLALSPFPFGNASSLIDCLLVGLPVVTWKGFEPHSLTDYTVIDACGLAEECSTSTLDEYLQRIIQFVNDDEFRERIRAKIMDGRLDKIHGADERPITEECVHAIRWAEKNSEMLRNSRGQVYFRTGNW